MKLFVISMEVWDYELSYWEIVAYRESEEGAQALVKLLEDHETDKKVSYEYKEISKTVKIPTSNLLDPTKTVEDAVKQYSVSLLTLAVQHKIRTLWNGRTLQVHKVYEFYQKADNALRMEAVKVYLTSEVCDPEGCGVLKQYAERLGYDVVLGHMKTFFDSHYAS